MKKRWKLDRPYIRAKLSFWDGDPLKDAPAVGLVPDGYRLKGELSGHPKSHRIPRSFWWIDGQLDKYSYNVEHYIQAVLNRVRGSRDKIAALDRTTQKIYMSVVLYILDGASTPAMGMGPRTMKALVDIGAELDVDMYVWNKRTFPESAKKALQEFNGNYDVAEELDFQW